jgi:hypothetical protein
MQNGSLGYRYGQGQPVREKSQMATETTLDEDFPGLDLEPLELSNGEWVIGTYEKPLTEAEARSVLIGYKVLRELVARQRR